MEVMEQETAVWKKNVVNMQDGPYYQQALRTSALFEEMEREVIEMFRERDRREKLVRKNDGEEGEGEEAEKRRLL